MPDFGMNGAISGLTTTTLPVLAPGSYTVSGKLSVPKPSNGSISASQVIVTVNKNGAPVFTSKPGADGFETGLNYALNDVVTIVTSSAATVDQELNAVKLSLSIYQGSP
jgi:hypothetical protein